MDLSATTIALVRRVCDQVIGGPVIGLAIVALGICSMKCFADRIRTHSSFVAGRIGIGLSGTSQSCASLVSSRLVWRSSVWRNLVWTGLAWSGLAWSGLAWSGLAWSGYARLVGCDTSSDATDAPRWVDDSFQDFSQGLLDDGGHNLYVARDGTLRTINRFDLNDDGHLDVLFNCTHNTYQMLPATAGSIGTGRRAISREIAVEGSQQVAIGDLNLDGWSDLVFCPNGIGVHHDRRFVSVAWGASDGWDRRRVNSPLPINGAVAVEIVDLNRDNWPDIAVLGGPRWMPSQLEGRIIRLYFGSPTGYSVVDMRDMAIPAAQTLTAADFDQDGARDLAVLRSDGKLSLLWSTPTKSPPATAEQTDLALSFADGICLTAGDVNRDGRPDLVIGRRSHSLGIVESVGGRSWNATRELPAFSATQVTLADFDRDGHADLALTQFDQARAAGGEQAGAGKSARDVVRIMWGESSEFSRERTTALQIPLAVATAAADMDNDGVLDLVIAIHQGERTFGGESQVWFGSESASRQFVRGPNGFATSGTTHVAVAPAEQDLPARAVFCNSIGGELDESVPLHLFWGGRDGFDPDRVWKLPFHSGYESSAADLNADGFVDLIVLNSGHAGEHAHADPTLGANILWGGPDGLERSTQRSVLHEHFLGTSSVADLNRDGWLDLVLEPFGSEHPSEKEKLILYYGTADGFAASGRVALEMDGYAQEHLVADFNRDQWLDIAVTSRTLDCIRILWGGPDGFATDREQRLKVSGPVGVDAADFNGDGWLDVLAGSYNDPVSGHRDMGLVIFWGGRDGYRHSNAQWLPGFSPLGRTVADFDGDGQLDLVSPQHSGELTREDLACHIYWGSDSGFATRRRTTFFSDSVNDTLAGDFNGDGRIDLAVNSHTRHGDHRTESRVFLNDGERFANPKVQKLPTNGPHLMWAEDIGHIYHRKYRHSFESRVLTWDKPVRSGKLTSHAKAPAGTRMVFAVRTARTANELQQGAWVVVEKGEFAVSPADRQLQYRAEFFSDNGDRYPTLDRVEIALEP